MARTARKMVHGWTSTTRPATGGRLLADGDHRRRLPGMMEPRRTPLAYKEIGWTVSMCQLIALSGRSGAHRGPRGVWECPDGTDDHPAGRQSNAGMRGLRPWVPARPRRPNARRGRCAIVRFRQSGRGPDHEGPSARCADADHQGRTRSVSRDECIDRRLHPPGNLPITVVNHAEGAHAFDLFDDTRASLDVLRQTFAVLASAPDGRGLKKGLH